MTRLSLAALAAILALPALATFAALAADLGGRSTGRFAATCEDVGQFCGARTCGHDQIDAALACRALCPSSVILDVVPELCPLPGPVVLRRKG